MDYSDFSRMELLKKFYDKLTDEERKTFIMLHLNGKGNNDIVRILNSQKKQLDTIENQGKFTRDLGANVAGNVIYGVTTWLLGRLLKLIK